MEARNFITAREMLTDGNWLLTTMNGEARYQKPPLPTWLSAISGILFGIKSVAALRLPTVFMVMLIAVATYLLSLKLQLTKRHALLNALILISSFYIIGITNEAPWDIYTHAFILCAVYYYFKLFQDSVAIYKNALLGGFFIGLSFMSKGPIGIFGVLIPFLISYGIVFKYQQFRSKLLPILLSLIVATIFGGWWFMYVRYADPSTFLAITKTETSNWSSYNVKPFYYYWSFFTQSGLWTIPAFVGLLYPYLKTRVVNLKMYRFTLLWTLASLVLLSIVPEKKARYLVPVLIPLALNTGFYIDYLIRQFKSISDKKELIPVYLHFALIALIGIAFPFAAYILLGSKLNDLLFMYILSSLSLVAIAVLIIVYLRKKDILKVLYLSIAFFAAVLVFVLPLSKGLAKNTDYYSIATLQDLEQKKQFDTYVLDGISPELLWEYGGKLPTIKSEDKTTIPKLHEFAILIGHSQEKLMLDLFAEGFEINELGRYDLNKNAAPGKRGHKERLVNTLYLLSKK
jgi:4-amino-4-deoxy-L-arabinose transferase-like glycosyltransferase